MNEKLNHFHIVLLIYMIQAGVVLFSLPKILAANFGYNGWIALFGVGAIVFINIYLISIVYRKGGGMSIFDILEKSLPKFVLYPMYIGLAMIWAVLGCLVAKKYVVMFQFIAFPTTHPMLFKLIFDVLVFLLLIKGIYNICKASTVFFFLTFWMLLLLAFFIRDFEWARLTPYIFQGDTNYLKGTFEVYFAFLGYELALLLFPYVERNRKFVKAIYWGNLITMLGYAFTSFITFGFYSLQQLIEERYPLLDLLSYIRFPFMERIDNLLFGFFLLTTIITIVMYLWASMEVISRIFPKTNVKWLAFSVLAFAYIVAWKPDVLYEIEQWLMYVSYTETAIAFGLPLLLILLLWFQKRGQKHA